MLKPFKLFFTFIFKIMMFCFLIPVGMIFLPFYGIYKLFCSNKNKSTPPVKRESKMVDIIDHIEEIEAALDD